MTIVQSDISGAIVAQCKHIEHDGWFGRIEPASASTRRLSDVKLEPRTDLALFDVRFVRSIRAKPANIIVLGESVLFGDR
jgi:hypothetical protein